jgi:nanoRNase/pAp phosphatase (c-di-AMP/oligoRNAs hydrolase)
MHLFNTTAIQTFFQLVEQYDVITIYRHIAPDGDALGSQFGLKQYLLDTYPHKQVYA